MKIRDTRIFAFFKKRKDTFIIGTKKLMFIIPMIFALLGLVLVVVSFARMQQIKASQTAQLAAETWQADTKQTYDQITCIARGQDQTSGPDLYIDSSVSLNVSDLEAIRKSIDLTVASYEKDSKNTDDSDTPIWIDAYSASTKGTVGVADETGNVSSIIDTEIYGVGGSYSEFHPTNLISGCFLTEEKHSPYNIVLDEALAWKLFSSNDVIGQKVMVGSLTYTVVGVVAPSENEINEKSYGEYPKAYIYFDELTNFLTTQSSADASQAGSASGLSQDASDSLSQIAITCYEVLVPENISGVSLNNLSLAISTYSKTEHNFLLIDNTDRFSLLNLYDTFFPLGDNTIWKTDFPLPYWEVSAQNAEIYMLYWYFVLFIGITLVAGNGVGIYHAFRKKGVFRSTDPIRLISKKEEELIV